MSTVNIKDVFRNIGFEVETITVEQTPYDLRNHINVVGFIKDNPRAEIEISSDPKVFADVERARKTLTPQEVAEAFGSLKKIAKPPFSAKKILKNGDYMTVLWADGTKTIVKRAADEAESDYAAFTAAVAIRAYGSNSALKRIIEQKVEIQKKRKKK